MHQQGRTMARYVVPAIGGLCVAYLYNIVDGIFVGQGVGAAALGAVNIGVPFITFVVAAAAMFPMGGATAVAIAMGRGDRAEANRAFQTALTLTVLLSLLLMGVGMGLAPPRWWPSAAGRSSAPPWRGWRWTTSSTTPPSPFPCC